MGDAELTTDDWARVFAEAAALGVLQVNLTGGEPLVRGDLQALVAAARKSDLYINLITSGIPADPDRLAGLAAGPQLLEHRELAQVARGVGRR